MRWHSFVSKIVFICNLLFVYCLLVRKAKDFIGVPSINSVILLLGWMSSPFLNVAINIWWLTMLIAKKPVVTPKWLLLSNLVFFVFQIIVLLFIL